MKKTRLLTKWLLLLSLLVVSPLIFAQDLILTAPPREKPADGLKQYGPLADYLTKLLGQKVVYQHPGNWLTYQRDMREDKYDIIFDGPHFISWRMLHLDNEVLVRLPGTLEFYLIAKKSDDKLNSIDDMIAQEFCGINPPNLATLSIIAAFPNPVRQPVIKGIRGGAATVYKAFIDGQCPAAVVRSGFFKKGLKDDERAKLKIIYASKPYPDQAISVSKRVTAREKSLIVQALTNGDGVKATQPIIKRFGGKATHFIPAKHDDYVGINTLLEGVIFGWE
jgi:ABC-type phosphate/phosphonate transport system substrate-binding protein